MKKLVLLVVIACSLVACNDTTGTKSAKDSLDSVANMKKDVIDSSADAKKDKIDSATTMKKNMMDSSAKMMKDTMKKKM